MAEFQCFIERFSRQDEQFVQLYSKLEDQQKECLHNVEEISKKLKDYSSLIGNSRCYENKTSFDSYFKAYSNQFVEKGVNICMRAVEDEISQNNDTQSKKAKLSCLKFYHTNLLIFKDNTVKKLRSYTDQQSFDLL